MKKIKLLTGLAGLTALSSSAVALLATTGCSKQITVTIENGSYDKDKSHLELNKDSTLYLIPKSGKTIIGLTSVSVGGVKLTSNKYIFEKIEESNAEATHKLTIKAAAMTSTDIKVELELGDTPTPEEPILLLDGAQETVAKGSSFQVTATVYGVEDTPTIIWKASQDDIVSFDALETTSGSPITITGEAVGNVTITAYCEQYDLTESFSLAVQEATTKQLVISCDSHNIDCTDTTGYHLSATVDGLPVTGVTFTTTTGNAMIENDYVKAGTGQAGSDTIVASAAGCLDGTFEVEVADFSYFDENKMKPDRKGVGSLVAKDGLTFNNVKVNLPNRYYDATNSKFVPQAKYYPISGSGTITELNVPANINGIYGDTTISSFTAPTIQQINGTTENETFDVANNCLVIRSNPTEIVLGCSNSVIASTTTAIRQFAFMGVQFNDLDKVDLSNVTQIGSLAFMSSNIKQVNNTDKLAILGVSAFRNCTALTAFNFTNNATDDTALAQIGPWCFDGCTNIKTGGISFANTGKQWTMDIIDADWNTESSGVWTPSPTDVAVNAAFLSERFSNAEYIFVDNIFDFETAEDKTALKMGSVTTPFKSQYIHWLTYPTILFPNNYYPESGEATAINLIARDGFKGCQWYSTTQWHADLRYMTNCTSLSSGSFNNITNLLTINLPNTITDIPANVLSGCTSLNTIVLTAFTNDQIPGLTGWTIGCFSNIGSTGGTILVQSGTTAAWEALFTNIWSEYATQGWSISEQ